MNESRHLSRYLAILTLSAVGLVLILPVVAVYQRAILTSTGADFDAIFQFGRQAPLLARSIAVAGGAAVLALILGVWVGIAVTRAHRIVKIAIGFAAGMSLLTPPYVFAIAWIDLWGPVGWLYHWAPEETALLGVAVYSLPGAAIALAAAYYPIIAIAAYIALRRVDQRWKEAASIAGQYHSYVREIALPAIISPIAAGFIVVFLLALYDFPVHSLLQVNTYLIEIHAASEYHNYSAAVLLSIPLVIISGVFLIAARTLIRNRGIYTDAGIMNDEPNSFRLGLVGSGCLVVTLASIFPMVVVASRAMPPATFLRLFETAGQELGSSLILAFIAATLITGLGTISSLAFTNARSRAAVDVVSAIPFLISGPLLGLGMIAVYNRPGPAGMVYDSAAILLLAWAARFGFVAQWGIGAGVRGQAPSGREAARVAGVSWLRMQFAVVIAQARPYIAMVWGATFVLTFREIDTAVLVAPPGLTLASVRLFTLMHYGPDGYVMAMALTMSAVMITVGASTYCLFAQWKRITDARP